MNPKVRNHLASLCFHFVKQNHPTEFAILAELAEENYKTGTPLYTLASVWSRFVALKRAKEAIS